MTSLTPSSDLDRIALGLERIATVMEDQLLPFEITNRIDFTSARVWQWSTTSTHRGARPHPLNEKSYLPLSLILGSDDHIRLFSANLETFARGTFANHVLLWGTRGCGKSSIAIACIANALNMFPDHLRLIEIQRDCLAELPALWTLLSRQPDQLRFILFCDDLSFEAHNEGDELSYKSLKSTLDGGLMSRTNRILFVATSNRRHLMPRDMTENERKYAIHDSETIDEKVSLSDRFGLWLGIHAHDQAMYLRIIEAYLRWAEIPESTICNPDWKKLALAWSIQRGNRSGRVAWQFFIDYCAHNTFSIPALPWLRS